MVRFGAMLFATSTVLVGAACNRTAPPPPPQDADLSLPRAAFHCSAPRDANETEACHILREFESARAISEWPAGKDVQLWLGVDHCVTPSASPDYDAYDVVYLRAGKGTAPLGKSAPEDQLGYSAIFAADQLKKGSLPASEEALKAVAQGARPDPSKPSPDLMIAEASDNAFQTLVRTPSGVSVTNGSTWFLRTDGKHLFLVGPEIQSGCVSELFAVPADLIGKPSSKPASSK